MNLYESIKKNLNEDDVYVNDTKVVGNGGVHTGVLKSIVDRNKSKISDILSNWNINSISYQENNDSGQSYGGVIIDATNKQDSRYTTATTFWLMLKANDSSYMDCYQVLEFTNGDDFESLVDDDSIHQLISDETLGMRELVAKIEDTLLSLIKKVYSDFDDIVSYRANNNILTESDFALDFEKNIPHHMRFKYYDSIPVNDGYGREKGRALYWVTQEPFDDLDIERFRDAFVDTGFSDAYVTVRDLSNYDFNSDKDAGVLVHISKDGKIDADDYLAKANDRGWFNEADKQRKVASIVNDSEESKTAKIEIPGFRGTDDVIKSYKKLGKDATVEDVFNDLVTNDPSFDKTYSRSKRAGDDPQEFKAIIKKIIDKLNEGAQSFTSSDEADNDEIKKLHEDEELEKSKNIKSLAESVKNILSQCGASIGHVDYREAIEDAKFYENNEISLSCSVKPDKISKTENEIEIYGTLVFDKDLNLVEAELRTGSGPNILNYSFIKCLNALYSYFSSGNKHYDL